MTASNSLKCLLEKGKITQEQYNELVSLVAITGSLTDALALSALTSAPFRTDDVDAIDQTTPKSGLTDPTASKAVLTAFGNDVLFTVVEGEEPDSASGFGHLLKEGTNYTFTAAELTNLKMVAFDSSATASVTFTFYK